MKTATLDKQNWVEVLEIVNNRTRSETPLSDSEAFKWSKKAYVAVNLDAQKRMDEILGFKSFGKTWRNVNINIGN